MEIWLKEGLWVSWVGLGLFSYKLVRIYCRPTDPGSLYNIESRKQIQPKIQRTSVDKTQLLKKIKRNQIQRNLSQKVEFKLTHRLRQRKDNRVSQWLVKNDQRSQSNPFQKIKSAKIKISLQTETILVSRELKKISLPREI